MKWSILSLESVPIIEQLYIEEALLRADDRNVLLINRGSPTAIVMGIAGKPEELIYKDKVIADNIPVIRRFSGGGTVVIDENTLFVTLICNSDDVDVDPLPKSILEWGQKFYASFIPNLELRENDFTFGELKVGGNAQYIRKGRWLLHTSFLMEYSTSKMAYLKLPPKRPAYRKDRKHGDFLTTLNKHTNVSKLIKDLEALGQPLQKLGDALLKEHRRSTSLLNISQ